MTRSTVPLLVTIAILGAALTGCACGKERWCEHDSTDTVVSNSYCQKNTPGYEWEEGSSSKKKKKKHRH